MNDNILKWRSIGGEIQADSNTWHDSFQITLECKQKQELPRSYSTAAYLRLFWIQVTSPNVSFLYALFSLLCFLISNLIVSQASGQKGFTDPLALLWAHIKANSNPLVSLRTLTTRPLQCYRSLAQSDLFSSSPGVLKLWDMVPWGWTTVLQGSYIRHPTYQIQWVQFIIVAKSVTK